MAIDALALSVIVNELRDTLVSGKVTKIFQPEVDEVIINIYCKGENRKLLVCVNSGITRMHLTAAGKQNPQTAPTFCMLLRKHLTNATVLSIEQMRFERVVDIKFKNSDELGYAFERHVIVELTGKTANVILTDGDFTIVDTLKHFPLDMERDRWFVPGLKYTFFAPQMKIAPDDFKAITELLANRHGEHSDILAENLLGVSRETINSMLFSSDNSKQTVDKIKDYLERLNSPKPAVLLNNGVAATAVPVYTKGEAVFFDSFNSALDEFYVRSEKSMRFREKAKTISTAVRNAISRTEKKLTLQKEALFEAENSETNMQIGNLILSNLHLIKKNTDAFETINYYDNNNIVVIKLDPTLSAQANAQNYFKKYSKQKKTAEYSRKLIEENTEQLACLNSISESLKYSIEMSDLEEIYGEVLSLKLIKSKPQATKPQTSKYLEYDIFGFKVLAGKNNVQNDLITFKLAKPDDLWLHTKDVHSSHVVIKSCENEIPDNVITAAAEITAFFSQARSSGKTVVDYTRKKCVKKPQKGAIGFAAYTDYSSCIVLPNEHRELLAK